MDEDDVDPDEVKEAMNDDTLPEDMVLPEDTAGAD